MCSNVVPWCLGEAASLSLFKGSTSTSRRLVQYIPTKFARLVQHGMQRLLGCVLKYSYVTCMRMGCLQRLSR